VTDMKNGTIYEDDIHYIDSNMYEQIKNYTISKDDLYITIAGTIGQIGIIPDKFDNVNLTENAAKIVFNNSLINKLWLKAFLSSTFAQLQFSEKTTTKTSQPKLALTRISTALIALPPLETQGAIVQKLENMMESLKELEIEIIQNEKLSDILMQAVLKETFEVKLEEEIIN